MSGTSETHIRSLLDTMVKQVDIILDNNSCSERFPARYTLRSLSSRLVFSNGMRDVTRIYASKRIHNLRHDLLSKFSLSPADLKTAAAELVLWSLIQSHSSDIPDERPLLHHWLPLCYTKNFASRTLITKRGAYINQVYFTPEGEVSNTSTVRDTFFAHDKSDEGYYPPNMEKFFGRIETEYSERNSAKPSTVRNAWSDVVLYAFFAVQSARNPDAGTGQDNHKNERFMTNHKARIIPAIFEAIDSFDSPNVQYAQDCKNLRFSPFFPPRVRKTMSGISASVFPLNPTTAFIITDSEISEVEARRIAIDNSGSMIHRSARTGQPLYGNH